MTTLLAAIWRPVSYACWEIRQWQEKYGSFMQALDGCTHPWLLAPEWEGTLGQTPRSWWDGAELGPAFIRYPTAASWALPYSRAWGGGWGQTGITLLSERWKFKAESPRFVHSVPSHPICSCSQRVSFESEALTLKNHRAKGPVDRQQVSSRGTRAQSLGSWGLGPGPSYFRSGCVNLTHYAALDLVLTGLVPRSSYL